MPCDGTTSGLGYRWGQCCGESDETGSFSSSPIAPRGVSIGSAITNRATDAIDSTLLGGRAGAGSTKWRTPPSDHDAS
jgi:hypothetical protein